MASTNSWGSDIPAEVKDGLSGKASHTAYAPICGGTTATGPQQSVASVGTSGQVLTSAGASALPSFQDATGGSSGGDADTKIFAYADLNGTLEPNFSSSGMTYNTTIVAGHPGTMKNISITAWVNLYGWVNGNGTLDFLGIAKDRLIPAGAAQMAVGYIDDRTSPILIDNGIYFFHDGAGAGTGNWLAKCESGGTITAEDTGVTAALQWRSFEINVNAAGTSAVFKIDGNVTNTITTNLPASTVPLFGGWWGRNAGAGGYFLDSLKMESTIASRI